ncbi:glycosyltransferase family 87 protein [Pedococcus cremeus]|uniref:glycosyltransferase family 87 protein n=1 Tax=Pedococcus cremeus TaxID=587636 RepID=UPI0015A5F545|nr:glycosyltransferase family 87 protein [Pedococcus cremeus]
MSVRDRLPRDLAIVIGVADTYVAVRGALRHGLGWDAHAYFLAWPGSLYDVPPGQIDAYNYSPAFAQLIWPLAHLPWPAFCALFVGAAAVGTGWLLRPLRLSVGLPLWFAFTPEILSGNIYWLLAVVAVLGLGRGWPWVLAALTKVLPTPGPLWFLIRGDWGRLTGFAAAFAAVTAVSIASAPDLWRQWFDFLTSHRGDTGAASLAFVPPLWLRLPVALVLLAWGARRDRPWVLAPVMLLATPVVGMGSFALLAALPRLRMQPAAEDHLLSPLVRGEVTRSPGDQG